MTLQQQTCDICGDPTDGYVCRRDTDITAGYLRHVVDLASEVETNVARLARYATRGGRPAAQVEEQPQRAGEVNRRQPVEAFAWEASKDRPKKGALRPTPLPVDLNASTRAAAAFGTVATWARAVEGDRGGEVPGIRPGEHAAAVAAAWLLGQLDWVRHQQFAAEAFDELRAAGATVQRIVDRPPDVEVVGVCDCGEYLYARRGASVVRCSCDLSWDVRESRSSLVEALRDRRVTVAEAATLGVLAFPDLQRDKVRKLVQSWVRTDRPNHLLGQPGIGGPTYPFGDILDRLSRSVLRFDADDRVNVTA